MHLVGRNRELTCLSYLHGFMDGEVMDGITDEQSLERIILV